MTARSVRDLLLAPQLAPEAVSVLLRPYGFRDPAGADRNLQRSAEDPRARELLAAMLPDLLESAGRSAEPDQALNCLERFLRASLSPLEILATLRERPRALELLVLTLGASPFMAEILIRNPTWFPWLADPQVLHARRETAEIEADLDRALDPLQSEARRLDMLRITKRREILHVGVRDLLRLASVEETVGALSALAEALLQAAYAIAEAGLRIEHGLPPLGARAARAGSGFAVMGLGKLGAGELNFSSDVDLVYLYATDRGRVARSAKAPLWSDWARLLSRRVTAALGDTTAEGSVYRVDLRLRPEGGAGAIASALPTFERYYRSRGTSWERLALLRAWPVAGDRPLGQRMLERIRPFVFSRPFGAGEAHEILELKQRIDKKMAARGQSERNVKLGVGGIREVELVVQALQVRHGRRRPRLRDRSTLAALGGLREAGLLPAAEADALAKSYLFLRDVENKLQMVADAQVHSLPEREEEVRACALRLGYRDSAGLGAGAALLADSRRHREATHRIFQEVFERIVGSPK
jgi:glutamate-ammonia-ligase adenylyltransferase